MQILHTGRYAYHPFPVAPSALRAPINRFKPRELVVRRRARPDRRLRQLRRAGARGGLRRRRDHGLGRLLHQRVPRAAHQPAHATSGAARSRIARVSRSKSCGRRARAVGRDFIIIFRISGLDLVEGGGTGAEVEWLASQMEDAGASMLNTGIGWHEARIPTIAGMVPRGAFGWVSARIKAATRLPVIATNRFNAPRRRRGAARERRRRPGVDGAAAARGSGPAAQGGRGTRRRDQHLHRLQPGLSRSRVREQARHLPGESARRVRDGIGARRALRSAKRIAVVGAGPAGLACATALAERGHRVTLFERAHEIGGQFRYAREMPGKEDFRDTLRYFARRIELTGVELELNTVADRARCSRGKTSTSS